MGSVATFFERALTPPGTERGTPNLPTPPSRSDESIMDAQRKARRAARQARGLGDTVLTGALGDTSGPSSTKKQLLG